jgi:transposase
LGCAVDAAQGPPTWKRQEKEAAVERFYVGVDLHLSVVQVCVMGEDGAVAAEKRFRGRSYLEGCGLVDWIEGWRGGGAPVRIAVEALGLNRWFVNLCRSRGLDLVVANARKLGLRTEGRKTDRRDARELARRLRLGDLDTDATTYYASDPEHAVRTLLRTRHELVGMRLAVTNGLRARLNAYRIDSPAGALYSRAGLSWLGSFCWTLPGLARAHEARVAVLHALQQQIQALDDEIERLAQEPRIEAARHHLPSVGIQTAATLFYELGDVGRFRSPRGIAAFAGIVPKVAGSGDKHHHGPLTKKGNGHLRWILNQWAVRLLTHDPVARAWAAPLRKRMHGNKVRTALARRLLVGVYFLLRHGEEFSLERCLGQARAA